MKTIYVKKSNDFPINSKVYLNTKSQRIHIKGFESYQVSLEQDDSFFISHQWTKSKTINYTDLEDGAALLVKPLAEKILFFIFIIIFSICLLYFLLTKNRWSFMPLVPFALYFLLMVTVLKNRYLRVRKI